MREMAVCRKKTVCPERSNVSDISTAPQRVISLLSNSESNDIEFDSLRFSQRRFRVA